MYIVTLVLAATGIAAAIGVPLRLFLLRRWFAVFRRAGVVPKVLAALGLLLLAPATFLWLYALYVAWKVFLDPGTPRVWGGSELGMTLTALGMVYFATELLLLPVTLGARRNGASRAKPPG